MDTERSEAAARAIWQAWSGHHLIDGVPEACRPGTAAEGYAVQAALARLAGARPVGWKIAATSAAGQKHIGVGGPLAGRLWESKLHRSGVTLPAGHLHMAVVEAEFAFRLGRDLPGGNGDYTVDAVMDAVAALHPAIEIPDSRFNDFTVVGAAQLIADNGCTEYCVLGLEAPAAWRDVDLPAHPVVVTIDGEEAATGKGANALGDPRLALTWLANDRIRHGVRWQPATWSAPAPAPIATCAPTSVRWARSRSPPVSSPQSLAHHRCLASSLRSSNSKVWVSKSFLGAILRWENSVQTSNMADPSSLLSTKRLLGWINFD